MRQAAWVMPHGTCGTEWPEESTAVALCVTRPGHVLRVRACLRVGTDGRAGFTGGAGFAMLTALCLAGPCGRRQAMSRHLRLFWVRCCLAAHFACVRAIRTRIRRAQSVLRRSERVKGQRGKVCDRE